VQDEELDEAQIRELLGPCPYKKTKIDE